MADEAIAEFLLMPVEMIKQIITEGTVGTV